VWLRKGNKKEGIETRFGKKDKTVGKALKEE
jgi:hypothetical protein